MTDQMKPEKAALATLRAQLGYAGQALNEKQAEVLNRKAALDRAKDDRDSAQKRYSEYLSAIRILEQNGYGDE